VNVGIYRKPTFTDSIIPFTSNHPIQHKYAAIKFLHTILNSYSLLGTEYTKEKDIIQNILHNNAFPATTHNTHTLPHHPSTHSPHSPIFSPTPLHSHPHPHIHHNPHIETLQFAPLSQHDGLLSLSISQSCHNTPD
jgi:hypothetical protein